MFAYFLKLKARIDPFLIRDGAHLSRQQKHRRRTYILCFAAAVLTLLCAGAFAGEPLIRLAAAWAGTSTPDSPLTRIMFVALRTLQTVVLFLPGEAVELLGGWLFGTATGTLLCLVGSAAGSCAILYMVRRFGEKAAALFIRREKLASLSFFKGSKRFNLLIFLLFLIPGTPKDAITYAVALTPMRMRDFVLLSTIARIPSVLTSAIVGEAAVAQAYTLASAILVASGLCSLGGIVLFRRMLRRGRIQTVSHSGKTGMQPVKNLPYVPSKPVPAAPLAGTYDAPAFSASAAAFAPAMTASGVSDATTPLEIGHTAASDPQIT
ncbi:MAG: SNARE associated Golgi protein [Firmicutes bacterium ADurb.Bin193]|nr:MAG: SNARE associated Golgi protein [Firmicutes bacterium ADurb.Bin193]